MKFGENQSAMRTVAARTLLLSAVAALTLASAAAGCRSRSRAQDPVTTSAIGPVKMRFLSLGIGKSVVVDLPRDVKDVLVADPKIANAVVRSSQRAYIIGGAVGQTNVVFFDADGQQVAVLRHRGQARPQRRARRAEAVAAAASRSRASATASMLTGSVSSPVEAQQAGEIAARLVGGADKVVNSIVVRGRDQVMLKVTVAEVRRDIVKQIGRRSQCQHELRHRGGRTSTTATRSPPAVRPLVAGNGLTAAALNKAGLPIGHRHPARDGERGRGEDAGRAEPDGDLRRVRDFHLRRRISDPDRRIPAKRRRQARSDNASRRSASRSSASRSTSRRSC